MFFKAVKDIWQRCKLWLTPCSKLSEKEIKEGIPTRVVKVPTSEGISEVDAKKYYLDYFDKVKVQPPPVESVAITIQTKIKAWVGHDGAPKQNCCLIGAPDEEQALDLIRNSSKFQKEFAVVERISDADFLFDNQTTPILDLESADKALYYYLVTT